MNDSQQTPRGDTAPLQRDNSRVNHEQRAATAADFAPESTSGAPAGATRPAFHQPAARDEQSQHGQSPQGQSQHGQHGAGPDNQHNSRHGGNQQWTGTAHQPQQHVQPQQPTQAYSAHPYQQPYAAQGYWPQSNPGGGYGAANQYPAQQPGTAQHPGMAQQPGPQQPGTAQQAAPVQQAAAPVQRAHPSTSTQYPAEPNPAPGNGGAKITPSGWLLRGLVLFGVSLLSGLVWLLVKPSDPADDQAQGSQPPQGKYQFHPELREEGFRGCANVSTEQIKAYFQQHQCEHLTRALYSTTLPDGQRALTSVVTVRMPDAASAAELNSLVSTDSTGNVMDLVSAGRDLPGEFPKLSKDVGYYSEQQDRLVVVGESGYFGKPPSFEDARLSEVTRDALRLGWPQDSTGSGS